MQRFAALHDLRGSAAPPGTMIKAQVFLCGSAPFGNSCQAQQEVPLIPCGNVFFKCTARGDPRHAPRGGDNTSEPAHIAAISVFYGGLIAANCAPSFRGVDFKRSAFYLVPP